MDADYFERWLNAALYPVPGGGARDVCLQSQETPCAFTPAQVARLISHLARLASLGGGGTLTADRLADIRSWLDEDGPVLSRDLVDARALLAHADSLSAHCAALAALVEGLNHVIACQREDSVLYQAGEREGRVAGAAEEQGRVLALLRARAQKWRAEALADWAGRDPVDARLLAEVHEDIARAVEEES